MTNTEIKIDGTIMTITVDLSKRQGVSQSGNTVTIASTQGAAKIGQGDISVNLSVYTKEGLVQERDKVAKQMGYKTWAAYQEAKKAEQG
jgi:hypothetical protein